jgi:hypothetical protein
VICQATGGKSVFMQAGSTQCPPGWSTEYEGFIMANKVTSRSEHICVDREATAAIDAGSGSRAAQISPAEINEEAGNLLNVADKVEIMCVVCSQPDPVITCPTIGNASAPLSGNVSVTCDNGNRYASQCLLSCPAGLVLQGERLIACQGDGRWSTDPTLAVCVTSLAVATQIYTRFGSSSCSDLETVIVVGHAVGSGREEGGAGSGGGGSNHMCIALETDQSKLFAEQTCYQVLGQATGGIRVDLGKSTSWEQCIALVRRKQPVANGVSYSLQTQQCLAQKGMTGGYFERAQDQPFRSCVFAKEDIITATHDKSGVVYPLEYPDVTSNYGSVQDFAFWEAMKFYSVPCVVCARVSWQPVIVCMLIVQI